MSSSGIKPFAETGTHSYHRRAFSHNYRAPFIYHIIIKKAGDRNIFGKVAGDARFAPGIPGCAKIHETVLGKIIAKSIIHLPYEYPILKPLQFCVMPDHIHLLIQVLFRSEKHYPRHLPPDEHSRRHPRLPNLEGAKTLAFLKMVCIRVVSGGHSGGRSALLSGIGRWRIRSC